MSGSPIIIIAGSGGRPNKVNGVDYPGSPIGPLSSDVGFSLDNTDGDAEVSTSHIAGTIEEISSVPVGQSRNFGPGQLTDTLP